MDYYGEARQIAAYVSKVAHLPRDTYLREREDLVQEAILGLLEGGRTRALSRVSAYIQRMVRAWKHEVPECDVVGLCPIGTGEVEWSVLALAKVLTRQGGMRKRSAALRACLLYERACGVALTVLAERYRLSAGGVRWHYHEAVAGLKKILERRRQNDQGCNCGQTVEDTEGTC